MSLTEKNIRIEDKKYIIGLDNLIQNSVSPQKKVLSFITAASRGGFEKNPHSRF